MTKKDYRKQLMMWAVYISSVKGEKDKNTVRCGCPKVCSNCKCNGVKHDNLKRG